MKALIFEIMHYLNFEPFPGLSSCHFQMMMSCYLPLKSPPPSQSWNIELADGDCLVCEVSTPLSWKEMDPTVVLVHGMGGSHASSYMVRMARKCYLKGNRVIRVNLRGCGSGKGLSKKMYNAGTSEDVLKVITTLKEKTPCSKIFLIGFSLGANVVLKLAGELGFYAKELVEKFMAVCPPIDLGNSVNLLARSPFYHSYFLKALFKQVSHLPPFKVVTLEEFDNIITAPAWGYKNALEYYQACSSLHFLPNIEQTTYILFAEDDPFIDHTTIQQVLLPRCVEVYATKKGGHLGFLGKTSRGRSFYWIDALLLHWIS